MIKTKNHNNNQTDTYQTNSQLINIQLNHVLTTNKNYIYNNNKMKLKKQILPIKNLKLDLTQMTDEEICEEFDLNEI